MERLREDKILRDSRGMTAKLAEMRTSPAAALWLDQIEQKYGGRLGFCGWPPASGNSYLTWPALTLYNNTGVADPMSIASTTRYYSTFATTSPLLTGSWKLSFTIGAAGGGRVGLLIADGGLIANAYEIAQPSNSLAIWVNPTSTTVYVSAGADTILSTVWASSMVFTIYQDSASTNKYTILVNGVKFGDVIGPNPATKRIFAINDNNGLAGSYTSSTITLVNNPN